MTEWLMNKNTGMKFRWSENLAKLEHFVPWPGDPEPAPVPEPVPAPPEPELPLEFPVEPEPEPVAVEAVEPEDEDDDMPEIVKQPFQVMISPEELAAEKRAERKADLKRRLKAAKSIAPIIDILRFDLEVKGSRIPIHIEDCRKLALKELEKAEL